jgi:uncharacterized membrane protein
MGRHLDQRLERWRHAGLIDQEMVEKIREFERARLSPTRSRWPVVVALAAGGLMLTAGVLLFVAAHWADLSPAARFAVLLAGLVGCHAGAAAVTERFPPLAVTLHTVGTAVLGAAVFLAGQTFHLEAEWPGGFLLWALGAWGALALLRSWPQLLIVALLTPAWVVAEWFDRLGSRTQASLATPAGGLLLLAIVYLLADRRREVSAGRTALAITGATALIPLTILTVLAAGELQVRASVPATATERAFWWAIAFGGPLAAALWLRGREAWPALIALVWVVAGVSLGRHPGVLAYLWAAAGAAGITAAGVYEANRRRINLGLAGFALTVVVFYFSSVLDKLGRATSLLAGGVLFLLLAWSLERLRRRLLARAANLDTRP